MADKASAFSAASSARRSPGDSLGKISSPVALALVLPLALARESIGRTRPAAQYRAQGEVLPRGAAPSGEEGGGGTERMSACVLESEFRCGALRPRATLARHQKRNP